jgi:hypothetical protein
MKTLRIDSALPLLAIAVPVVAALLSCAASAADWEYEIPLTNIAGYSSTAKVNAKNIVTEPSGKIHVVFADNRVGGYEIYYKRYNGSIWMADYKFAASGAQHYPAVAVDALSNIHVVWTDFRHGSSPYSHAEIYYRHYDGGSWVAEERLTYSGSARYPSIAAFGSDVHLVWQDSKSGSCDVYYRRFDGLGWSSEERVTATAASSMMPAAAVDGIGNLHVVWVEADTPDGDIVRYGKYNGFTWDPYQDLDSTFALTMGATSITAGADGRVAVAWSAKPTAGEDYEIYCRRFDGFTWSAVERVTYTTARSRHPSVAVNEDTIYVAYSEDEPGNGEIYCRTYDGSGWQPEERLTVATGTSYNPSATTDHDGRLHIVWEDWRVGGVGHSEVYYIAHSDWSWPVPAVESINPAAAPEGETVPFRIAGGIYYHPAQIWLERAGEPDVVATDVVVVSPETLSCNIDLGGAALGYWDLVVSNPGGQDSVLPSGFVVQAGLWEDEVRLTYTDSTSSTARSSSRNLIADASGNLHVVWHDNTDSDYDVYYKMYDGVAWSADIALTTDPADQRQPAIAADSLGGLHVVWQDHRHSYQEIYYIHHDGEWSTEERLTTNARECGHPSVAVDQANNVHVVWQGIRLNDGGIFHRAYDGVGWSSESKAPGSTMNARYPSCAADDSGKVQVVWNQVCTLNGDALRYSVHDSTGWSAYTDVAYTSGWTYCTPCIITSPGGQLHVSWDALRYHTEEPEIFYYHYDGLSWGPGERLTYSPEKSHYPSLAYYDDKIYIVYADARVGNTEIYCRVNAGGVWSPEMGISFARGESIYPTVATDRAGRVHVIWEDERHGASEVYYRMWDAGDISGVPDGDLVQLTPLGVRVFPNPVGRNAEIRFSVEAETGTSVSIYDITGRLVWTRSMGIVPAGEHHLAWPGTDRAGKVLSPGIYFINLRAGVKTSTAKIVIVGN